LSVVVCSRIAKFINTLGLCLKDKINELGTDCKKNNRDLYGGIMEFNKSYQNGFNLIKDDNGNLMADSRRILNMWKNCFYHLLNVGYMELIRSGKLKYCTQS
jgi:hypothetical protein